MFEGFRYDTIAVGEGVTLNVRHGGNGSPVLLLHGHPRTHATWHRVAPLLAARHAVVCPDLRGYGRSSKPTVRPDHAQQCKREMAADCVALMRALGYPRFSVVGHDRGAYVAFRAALDHPLVIEHVVVLDAIPILEVLERCDARFARAWWHWFFFDQPDKPERAILADPDAWYSGNAERMGDEAYADYRAAIHDPTTVHAMLEDYRAGLGIDREHDAADRAAGRRIACPVLVMWAAQDDLADLFGDIGTIWRAWAADLTAESLPCGHHMAEDAPQLLAERLIEFIAARR